MALWPFGPEFRRGGRSLSAGEDRRSQAAESAVTFQSRNGSASLTCSPRTGRFVGSPASWDDPRRRSAARSAATAIGTGAIAPTTPSTRPGSELADRGSDALCRMLRWLSCRAAAGQALERRAGRPRAPPTQANDEVPGARKPSMMISRPCSIPSPRARKPLPQRALSIQERRERGKSAPARLSPSPFTDEIDPPVTPRRVRLDSRTRPR